MIEPEDQNSHLVSVSDLDADFPTHLHSQQFWEELGRTVATFGFLEDTLGRACFALQATTEVNDDEFDEQVGEFVARLPKLLTDSLGPLIDNYEKSLRSHQQKPIKNSHELLAELRKAKTIRDVICHGSWGLPDKQGKSTPRFFNRKEEVFATPIDTEYLRQCRSGAVALILEVINSVTVMGYEFPGTEGPGNRVWQAGVD